MSTPGVGRTSSVQSLDRAAQLLRCFGPQQGEFGASELARRTGLSVSTTHRLVVSLAQNGLLRPTGSGRYTLGPLISQLARSGVGTRLHEVAPTVMQRLRDEVDETVGLHELLMTDERIVVDQAESDQPLHRRYTEIGVPIPLPYGAPGKVILAFLPHERREAVLARPLRKVTPNTIVDAARLRRELAAVRGRGYAVSFAERTPGVHTVAAPIWDGTAAVVGSLSVSGPQQRMERHRMRQLVSPLCDAAWSLGLLLGASEGAVAQAVASAADA